MKDEICEKKIYSAQICAIQQKYLRAFLVLLRVIWEDLKISVEV